MLWKTKSDNYPNGVAWEFVAKAQKPSDESTGIELEVESDQLQLKGVIEFYNDVVRVMDKYDVTKTEYKLCVLMALMTNDMSHAIFIPCELKSGCPNFDRLRNSASEIQ